jgi:hypothetical protein
MQKWSIVPLGLAVAILAGPADAGQFKRLSATATLVPGAQVQVFGSPQNQGAAMEMDVYEFLSAGTAATLTGYRCRILSNSTGQTLNLRLIGVNGSVISSCAATSPGFCDLPFSSLVGNLLFQCTVATGNGAPVIPSRFYSLAVQRQPLILIPPVAESAAREILPSGAAR